MSSTAIPLPDSLRDLFQEYDFDELSWRQDRELIMDRILSRGPWDAVQWLRRQVGDAGIREWIEETRGRSLDRRRLRFWQLILRIPAERVDAWLERRASDPWENRWAK